MFEQNARLSMFKWLLFFAKHLFSYEFNANESLEFNDGRATLIDQMDGPIIIKVNPFEFPQLKKIVEAIEPDHIIIGDIYNEHRLIDVALIRQLKSIIEAPLNVLWCSSEMTDITDIVSDINKDELNFQIMNTSCWVEYFQF